MSRETEQNIDGAPGGGSVVDLHDAVRREKTVPPSGREPLRFGRMILGFILLLVAAGYLGAYSNGFRDSIYVSDSYRPKPRPSIGGVGAEGTQVAWIDKWMKEGKIVYGNCLPCHQANGMGLPGVFPPLKGSEWVNGGTSVMAAILLKGINGPFTVAGQQYNGVMQPWETLSDEKIAQVMTYVRREFGEVSEGDYGVVTAEMIAAAREKFSGRKVPWDEAGLKALPIDEMLPGPKVDLQTGAPLGIDTAGAAP
jgi:mono/diheme cytochrome c family protein